MRDYTYSNTHRRNHAGRSGHSVSSGQEWLHNLLFYILPFIVINGLIFFLVTTKPKCELVIGEDHDYLSTEIKLDIKSFLPTKDLTVTLDSEPLELEQVKKNSYKAVITKNGALDISVKSANGMTASIYEYVGILDDNPPSLNNSVVEDGILTFTIEDSQSGVNFDAIYATDSMGITIYPTSIDKATGTITFPIDSDGLTIYTSDLSGNQGQTTVTPQSASDGSSENSGGSDSGSETTLQTN
ncbi:hypothetical protein GPL15_12855 [Clostridium sp. MCC353]|uniref:hypothetical protein n=1 Tax=Clostridium sp. MCC353 TaxID=2592646 RepID=UPI001C02580D|nr:hypothetical protein [Clostridium sp. MCC353]MBT9777392.1 hypothetical protein [Clostridium sp. MCC353]